MQSAAAFDVFVYRRFDRPFQNISFRLWLNQSLTLALTFTYQPTKLFQRNLFVGYTKRDNSDLQISRKLKFATPRPSDAHFSVDATFGPKNKTDHIVTTSRARPYIPLFDTVNRFFRVICICHNKSRSGTGFSPKFFSRTRRQ